MSEKLYKVKGSFTILWSFDDATKIDTFKTYAVMEDLIKIALEDGHMKVKDLKVVTIREEESK